MRAITQEKAGGPEVLKVVAFARPELRERDLLVKVSAAGVNPVDFKVRDAFGTYTKAQILGWDAVGYVEETGMLVKNFKKGDRVYFCGDLTRNGSYAEYTAVDERLCAIAPKKLHDNEASVLPMSLITAWEAMEERLGIPVEMETKLKPSHSILIINGAGGVGSMAIQLAKKVFNLNVIATASRMESIKWCKELGADHVINHNEDLVEQLKMIGFEYGVAYILCCADANLTWDSWSEMLLPFGKACVLCSNGGGPAIDTFQNKGQTLCTEMVFTKSRYQVNMESQGRILRKASRLFDRGILRTTKNYEFPFSEISKAHILQQSGTTVGKISLKIGSHN